MGSVVKAVGQVLSVATRAGASSLVVGCLGIGVDNRFGGEDGSWAGSV